MKPVQNDQKPSSGSNSSSGSTSECSLSGSETTESSASGSSTSDTTCKVGAHRCLAILSCARDRAATMHCSAASRADTFDDNFLEELLEGALEDARAHAHARAHELIANSDVKEKSTRFG